MMVTDDCGENSECCAVLMMTATDGGGGGGGGGGGSGDCVMANIRTVRPCVTATTVINLRRMGKVPM